MSNGCCNIMLVDDNRHDNFFHEREIKKSNPGATVITQTSASAALEYLKSDDALKISVIFLDINMPGMNGWEFLQEYAALQSAEKSKAVVIMLTTSTHANDIEKAKSWRFVADYITKPLTKTMVGDITAKYCMGKD